VTQNRIVARFRLGDSPAAALMRSVPWGVEQIVHVQADAEHAAELIKDSAATPGSIRRYDRRRSRIGDATTPIHGIPQRTVDDRRQQPFDDRPVRLADATVGGTDAGP